MAPVQTDLNVNCFSSNCEDSHELEVLNQLSAAREVVTNLEKHLESYRSRREHERRWEKKFNQSPALPWYARLRQYFALSQRD